MDFGHVMFQTSRRWAFPLENKQGAVAFVTRYCAHSLGEVEIVGPDLL